MSTTRIVFSGVAKGFEKQLKGICKKLKIVKPPSQEAEFWVLETTEDGARQLHGALAQHRSVVPFHTAYFPTAHDRGPCFILGPLHKEEQKRIKDGPKLSATPAEILGRGNVRARANH